MYVFRANSGISLHIAEILWLSVEFLRGHGLGMCYYQINADIASRTCVNSGCKCILLLVLFGKLVKVQRKVLELDFGD